jgi:Spy/CpxP family protein refolding chaperone
MMDCLNTVNIRRRWTSAPWLRRGVVALMLLCAGTPVFAQGTGAPSGQDDRWARAFFAPELVMQHSRQIGLTDDQRNTITAAIQELQGKVVALQFRMLEEAQAALDVMEQPRVDESRAVQTVERVLELEQEVKINHVILLVRIKNVLTQEQQAMLRTLRDRARDSARDGETIR